MRHKGAGTGGGIRGFRGYIVEVSTRKLAILAPVGGQTPRSTFCPISLPSSDFFHCEGGGQPGCALMINSTNTSSQSSCIGIPQTSVVGEWANCFSSWKPGSNNSGPMGYC